MAAICGVACTRCERADVTTFLQRVYSTTWHKASPQPELWHDHHAGFGHITLGVSNLEPQPLLSSSRHCAIVFCGKLFDYTTLRSDLEKDGVTFRYPGNDAELLLHLFECRGLSSFDQLNGLFTAALWEAPRRRLWLVTDRCGFRLLYYHHSPEQKAIVFSSRLRAVVESGLYRFKINWPACSTFLHFGHCLGDETLYDEVYTVPPGSAVRFEDNRLCVEKYWDINTIQIDQRVASREAAEGYAHHFSNAVRRRNIHAPCKKMVFLSGGLDSRRIAGELAKQGAEFSTYTTRGFNPAPSEGLTARLVAQTLGVPNKFVDLPTDDFYKTCWTRCLSLVDYETTMHACFLPLVESLADDERINYDGIAGDVVPNAVLRQSPFWRARHVPHAQGTQIPSLAQSIIGQASTFSFFSTHLRKNLSQCHVFNAVVRELRKYQETPNQLTCFYLLNRTRRAIALNPFRVILTKAESFCPYLDNDVFTYVMQIPPELRMSSGIRQQSLDLAFPDLTDIEVRQRDIPQQAASTLFSPQDYYRQRRQWLFADIWHHYIRDNWMLSNIKVFPRVARALLTCCGRNSRPLLFPHAHVVFMSWLQMNAISNENVCPRCPS